MSPRIIPLFLAVCLFAPAVRAADDIAFTISTKIQSGEVAIPDQVQAVRTLGYHEPGSGGGLYVYSGTTVPTYTPRGQGRIERPSSHYLASKSDAGGVRRYFMLSEEHPNVLQFGAIADATPEGASTVKGRTEAHDNTEAFNAALSYGKGAYVPTGRYWIKGTVVILEDSSVLTGDGPGGNNTGGSELYFGPGAADCIQAGDGSNQLRWAKISRLTLDPRNRTGGNAIFAWFNFQLSIEELRISTPYNGISLFRGIGFMIRDVVMSGIRAGDGTVDGPTEIGYGIKFWGAPELYDKGSGRKVKRDTQVLFVENISFGSQKHETDPTNWTVGLWCAENAASINGATLKNQNVRHGVYISRAASTDATNKLVIPDGYILVPATKTVAGKEYQYGSDQYPTEPGQVPDLNGRFQDLTLFYLGGDYLGGEYIYNEEGAGVAIYNPHFMRSYQGNCVYMGPNSRDMSVYGGQVIGAFKNGFDMNGERWHISGVQIYRASLDSSNREKHKGNYSAIRVGPTSVGGDIINCKLGNEPAGVKSRAGNTVQYGLDIAAGAKGTWYDGNRFDGCIEANVNNQAGDETQAGSNFLGRVGP